MRTGFVTVNPGGSDGPGYQWPASNHGLNIDNKGNVWIGGNGTGFDGHVLKSPFTIDVFTLFPRMFDSPLDESILRRAKDRNPDAAVAGIGDPGV